MASSIHAERPLFLIFAGPNGSGKSSVYQDSLTQFEGRTIWVVNPDLLTARIQHSEKLPLRDANLAAVRRLENWLEASLDVHKSVGVETVLSTDKYRRLVTKAKSLNFEIGLVYVLLENPDLNIARVAARVVKGGHNVAEADIRRRYARSFEQMPWFLQEADFAVFYDNSGAQPRRVGRKSNGKVSIAPSAPRILFEALSKT